MLWIRQRRYLDGVGLFHLGGLLEGGAAQRLAGGSNALVLIVIRIIVIPTATGAFWVRWILSVVVVVVRLVIVITWRSSTRLPGALILAIMVRGFFT